MKLKRLGLAFMVLGLTITTSGCSSEKTANLSNGADNPPVITSPQPSNENTPATLSPTAKPSTSSPTTPSPTVKASSKITNGDQAAALVKTKLLFRTRNTID